MSSYIQHSNRVYGSLSCTTDCTEGERLRRRPTDCANSRPVSWRGISRDRLHLLEPNQTGADRVQNHVETLARSGLRKRVFY